MRACFLFLKTEYILYLTSKTTCLCMMSRFVISDNLKVLVHSSDKKKKESILGLVRSRLKHFDQNYLRSQQYTSGICQKH